MDVQIARDHLRLGSLSVSIEPIKVSETRPAFPPEDTTIITIHTKVFKIIVSPIVGVPNHQRYALATKIQSNLYDTTDVKLP